MSRDVGQDREAIAALHDEHVEGVNAGNMESVLSGMTDDVVYMAPGQPAIVGKKQLEDFLRSLYAQLDAEITMTAAEVQVTGDWAYEWGTIGGKLRVGDGPATAMDAKYVYVYKRCADGAWRIARDIFNDNVPPG